MPKRKFPRRATGNPIRRRRYAAPPTGISPPETGTRALYGEGVPLARIADEVGTPAYVYSRASIEAAYRNLDRAFGSLPHTLCYAMKANSNLSVLRVLARLGSSFDIVSGGELDRLGRIGIPGNRIVFPVLARRAKKSAKRCATPEKSRATAAYACSILNRARSSKSC